MSPLYSGTCRSRARNSGWMPAWTKADRWCGSSLAPLQGGANWNVHYTQSLSSPHNLYQHHTISITNTKSLTITTTGLCYNIIHLLIIYFILYRALCKIVNGTTHHIKNSQELLNKQIHIDIKIQLIVVIMVMS